MSDRDSSSAIHADITLSMYDQVAESSKFPEGFYHFGWDILENLRGLGFEKAEALLYWSIDFDYLGNADQIIFLAEES